MKLQNDKEIIVGKSDNRLYMRSLEVPFFVGDIRQLCFNPYENASLFITKEQYDYLQNKLGANDDE